MYYTNNEIFVVVFFSGVHHKKSCFDMALIAKVQKLLSSVCKYLFPEKLEVSYAPVKKKVLRKGNGGWGDIRDHELCLRIVNRHKGT